jgi:hypothetical protein
MNPARITIEGNYWDCQIYRGRLYLFTIEGAIKVIDWNALIESIQLGDFINLSLNYAFKNGRELYNYEYSDLLKDSDIREVLRNKFEALNKQEITISLQQLDNFLLGNQDSPFKELHSDSEVFSNRLFVLTHNSLLSTSIHKRGLKYPVSTRPSKHFDLFGFSLKANRYARLAVSAGDDGLMEYNASFKSDTNYMTSFDDRRMRVVSNRHSSFADYSFLSIYNSSLAGDSFLAYHLWNEDKKEPVPERVKKEEFSETDIFKNESIDHSYLSWGYNEKIYRAVAGGIEMVRFNNYAKGGEPIFSDPKFIALQQWKGKVLSASTAYYGTILHCQNAVVVMLSDGSFFNIPGEISRFRIFPRSINYENHLHVIHDDKLEVYSFNTDYFVDQKHKDFGVAFRTSKSYHRYSGNSYRFVSDEEYFNLNDSSSESDSEDQKTEGDLPF